MDEGMDEGKEEGRETRGRKRCVYASDGSGREEERKGGQKR